MKTRPRSGENRRYRTADVFTDRIFCGNPLAVFPDGRGLSDDQMQRIAFEFNYSETVFVLPPSDSRHTRRLRIFTPRAEIPFAGHPTVGTAFVLASGGEIPLEGDLTRIVFEEGVGPVPVSIRSSGGQPTFTELSVAQLPELLPGGPTAQAIAPALSLDADSIGDRDLVPVIASCGMPFLFIPVRSVDDVSKAEVDLARWQEQSRNLAAHALYVFTTSEGPGKVRARMFAPDFGVPEDPATGSAAAALAGVLGARHPGHSGSVRWRIRQGLEMGRPSELEVEADLEDGELTAVRVGGASVLVSEGEMVAPE